MIKEKWFYLEIDLLAIVRQLGTSILCSTHSATISSIEKFGQL